MFLASPNDVKVERAIAAEIILRMNRITGRNLGIQLELLRWEDVQPGFGRPQSVINSMVDECDLFIGLLWERWGQSTGEFSSGFQEEFERAKNRREVTGTPEIWLFLKELSDEKLSDPGEQLRKVLEFREVQRQSNQLLFKEFPDADRWEKMLYDFLLEYILNLNGAAGSSFGSEEIATSTAALVNSPLHRHLAEGHPDVPRQLQNAVSNLGDALGDDNPSLDLADVPTEFDLVRTYLLLQTLMSRRYTGAVLGTHEVNLLYKSRRDLELTALERGEIFRCILADNDDANPGWFLLKTQEIEPLETKLLTFANADSLDAIKVKALRLLAATNKSLPLVDWKLLPLNDESWLVRRAALDVLKSQTSDSPLQFIEDFCVHEGASAEIAEARFEILVQFDPGRALAELTGKDEYVSVKELALFREKTKEIGENVLLNGLQSSDEGIKFLCLTELVSRGSLPTESAQNLLEDSSKRVRSMALLSLARKAMIADARAIRSVLKDDEEASSSSLYGGFAEILKGTDGQIEGEELVLILYSALPIDDVVAALSWFSVDGSLAYRALYLRNFDGVVKNIRADLAEGFARIREESKSLVLKRHGQDVLKQIISGFEEFNSFIKSQFEEAALISLSSQPIESDAQFAKVHLKSNSSATQLAAIEILDKVGKPGDSDQLLEIFQTTYGEAKLKAATAALKLSGNPLPLARKLLEAGDGSVTRMAFEWLRRRSDSEVMDIFKSNLHHSNADDRLRSVLYLQDHLEPNELENLLNEYVRGGTYFYNVVTWFDRLLYSTPEIKAMYLAELNNSKG